MSNHMLETIYQDFSAKLAGLGQLVCAGGAVRDHLRGVAAKDYDLFLLGRSLTDEIAAQISERLGGLEQVTPLEWHKSEPYLVSTVRTNDVDVQVMVNPAGSLSDLLATFDWNVCLFGYDGQVLARESIDNIGHGKELRLQKVSFPLSTLRRGFRFSERFKMKLRREDIALLCKQVLEMKTRQEPDMPALAANVLIEEPLL